MGLANCPECGKLYLKTTVNMCRDCYEKEEENERRVASYVREHPSTDVDTISKETGVKEKTIFRMIRSGRFLSNVAIQYPCESCGKMITKGRLCDECNASFVKQAQTVAAHHRKEEESRDNVPFARKKAPENKARSGGMYTKDMGTLR